MEDGKQFESLIAFCGLLAGCFAAAASPDLGVKHPPKLGRYLVRAFLPDLPFEAGALRLGPFKLRLLSTGLFTAGLFACGCPAPSNAESLRDTNLASERALVLLRVLLKTFVSGMLSSRHVELCSAAVLTLCSGPTVNFERFWQRL